MIKRLSTAVGLAAAAGIAWRILASSPSPPSAAGFSAAVEAGYRHGGAVGDPLAELLLWVLLAAVCVRVFAGLVARSTQE